METPRDERLAAELRALRPAPRPQFATELDERAAAGFPRRSWLPRPSLSRLRAIPPRRFLLASGAMALLAIVIATAVVTATREGDGRSGVSNLALTNPDSSASAPGAGGEASRAAAPETAPSSSKGSSGIQYEAEVPTVASEASSRSGSAGNAAHDAAAAELKPFSGRLRHRAVEHSAEIVLAAEPGDVGGDSSEVFEAVHAHDGIVMRSSTREGKPGQAGARFELLIPSARLSDALAAISAIDEVRSRHETSADITAPTVSTGELLRDSKARIDSLLVQLEAAETEGEREAVEAELRQERRHRARLRSELQHLQRRAEFSRVLVRIETGAAEEPSGSGAWGVDDALDDAGHVLAVAAAVTVVTLAILGPIALIALFAWLTHRAWVRRERRRVLS